MSLMRSRSFSMSRREPPPDPEVDARPHVRRIGGVHVVALLASDHLQGQLVMIAQEDRPLTALRNVGRLLHDLGDGVSVLLRDGHVDPRHEGK